jgi:hypothetical protein
MVCIRCKRVVKSELEKLGLHYTKVELGEAEILENISPEQMKLLDTSLRSVRLELMHDKNSVLVEKIKRL